MEPVNSGPGIHLALAGAGCKFRFSVGSSLRPLRVGKSTNCTHVPADIVISSVQCNVKLASTVGAARAIQLDCIRLSRLNSYQQTTPCNADVARSARAIGPNLTPH